ncbi:hypothetical protein PTW37_02750 [Arthrobacter agilis]|uniref:hypothetical protein n=1 Tax=Arthrobacter agilis TaxID=37921 RepID=UPI002366319A|nr:hypothetical protein [Arthrobacter agilis]WDF33860.1 hypothetical protein PTW37_02750 [Arthrobacter agilis]
MAKTRAQIARKYAAGAPTPAPPRPGSGQKSNGTLVFIAAAVAALFLFWYFHLLTLGQMTQLSDGLAMPDSLIGGYDVAHVEGLRAAMDDDARGQLSYLHKTAGTLFPLIFAFAWLLLVQLNTGRRWLRWLLWSPVLLFVVVDLWENVAIDAMLAQAAPEPGPVALASTLTVLRWVLLAVSLVAGATSVFLPRRLRTGGQHTGTPAAGAPAGADGATGADGVTRTG